MPKFATATRQAFPDFVDDFDAIEAETTAWVQRLKHAQASVKDGEARAEAMLQNNVEFLVAITAGGIAIRVKDLADATVTLINKNNPHAAPAVARALFDMLRTHLPAA